MTRLRRRCGQGGGRFVIQPVRLQPPLSPGMPIIRDALVFFLVTRAYYRDNPLSAATGPNNWPAVIPPWSLSSTTDYPFNLRNRVRQSPTPLHLCAKESSLLRKPHNFLVSYCSIYRELRFLKYIFDKRHDCTT